MKEQDIISSGLLELYVLGIASPGERQDVEQWAKQYPGVAAEIYAIEAGMESYAMAHAIAPGAATKETVFQAIGGTGAGKAPGAAAQPVTAKTRSISSVWKYAAAASIVLLVGSLAFSYTFYNKFKAASDDLQTAQTELKQQKELADAMHKDMGVMTDRNAMPVSLKAMPDVPDGAARIYWMQDTHEVYIDPSNLPQAPEGMQYQFWAIVDGKPVSGGMITTLKDGRVVHVQKMKAFGKAEAFAVSLEKAGPEKPAPSQVVVMGKI